MTFELESLFANEEEQEFHDSLSSNERIEENSLESTLFSTATSNNSQASSKDLDDDLSNARPKFLPKNFKKIHKEARSLIEELVDYLLPVPEAPKRDLALFFQEISAKKSSPKVSLVASLLKKRGISIPKVQSPKEKAAIAEFPARQSKFYSSNSSVSFLMKLNEDLTERQRILTAKRQIESMRKSGPEIVVLNGRIIEEEEEEKEQKEERKEENELDILSSESEAEFSESHSSSGEEEKEEEKELQVSSSSESDDDDEEEEIGAKLLDLISQKFTTSTLPSTPSLGESSKFIDKEAEEEDEEGNLIFHSPGEEDEEREEDSLALLQEMHDSKFIDSKNQLPDSSKVTSLFVQQEIQREKEEIAELYENVNKRSIEMDSLLGKYALNENEEEDFQEGNEATSDQNVLDELISLDDNHNFGMMMPSKDLSLSGNLASKGNQIKIEFEKKISLTKKDPFEGSGMRKRKFQLASGEAAEKLESSSKKSFKTFQIVNKS